MNVNSSVLIDWLRTAGKKLDQAGISTSRLDCLVLLEDALKKDRSYLLAHPKITVQKRSLNILNKQIERRKNHEPLAYIRGKSEFYGRDFLVNKHTLEPRPETETMIELLLKTLKSQKPPLKEDRPLTEGGNVILKIVDVGTGSGCIGISAKLEVPELVVTGVDISQSCLQVAMQNAKNLGADVSFIKGNLLVPLQKSKFDFRNTALLCNLPYVPDTHTINRAAMQEPKIAIFGGKDGLDLYRSLFSQIKNASILDGRPKYYHKPKYVFTESLPYQHDKLTKIAANNNYKLISTEDFIQHFELN